MNNRRTGHEAERILIRKLADEFNLIPFNGKNLSEAEIGSSRMFSRELDSSAVDIYVKKGFLKRLYWQVKKKVTRAKNTKTIDISALDDMPTDNYRIVATRLMKGNDKRASELGWYVAMELEEFLDLINIVEAHINSPKLTTVKP